MPSLNATKSHLFRDSWKTEIITGRPQKKGKKKALFRNIVVAKEMSKVISEG